MCKIMNNVCINVEIILGLLGLCPRHDLSSDTGMYMFDLDRRYNLRYNWPIVPLIRIKHVH